VLDEAHRAKCTGTITHALVQDLKTSTRILLTGTPVNNKMVRRKKSIISTVAK
jgi:type I site-specific restriction-modification system R (restriction) subunit